MKFSVDVFGGNDVDTFKTNEKLSVGCSIFIKSQSVKSVIELLNIKSLINMEFSKVNGTTLHDDEIVIACEFDVLEPVESIWDIAIEWESRSELLRQLLKQRGITCEWELKLNVGISSVVLEE